MLFNINYDVRIKLTQRGREIVKKQDLELIIRPGEDGLYKAPLWFVMQVFGPHLMMGFDPPFETEIEIPASPATGEE